MKKIVFGLVIVLFCSICVASIIVLNNQSKYFDPSKELSDFTTQKFYKEVKVAQGRLEDAVWVDGNVINTADQTTTQLTIWANENNLCVSKGGVFKKNMPLVNTNGKITLAPFNGRLENYQPNNGSLALTLINYEAFIISGLLNQELLEFTKFGDATKIQFSNHEYDGEFLHVSNIVNEENFLNFLVKYADTELKIPIGAKVKVKIMKKVVEDAIFIPEYALFKSAEDDYYVLVRDENNSDNIITQRVEIGIKGSGFIQILSGLTVSDVVVVDLSTNEKESAK